MKKVTAPQVASPDQAMRADLPEAVQAALGDLAGAAREGCWRSRSASVWASSTS